MSEPPEHEVTLRSIGDVINSAHEIFQSALQAREARLLAAGKLIERAHAIFESVLQEQQGEIAEQVRLLKQSADELIEKGQRTPLPRTDDEPNAANEPIPSAADALRELEEFLTHLRRKDELNTEEGDGPNVRPPGKPQQPPRPPRRRRTKETN